MPMNTRAAADIDVPPYRSEAFAEDVLDLVARAPRAEPLGRPVAPRLAKALLGLAFAAAPPLS
jgi:hypothetical protein